MTKIRDLHELTQALLLLLGKDFPKERQHIIEVDCCWEEIREGMSKDAIVHIISKINIRNPKHLEMLAYMTGDYLDIVLTTPYFVELIKRPHIRSHSGISYVSFKPLCHDEQTFIDIFKHYILDWKKFHDGAGREGTSPEFVTIKKAKAYWQANFFDKIGIKPLWR